VKKIGVAEFENILLGTTIWIDVRAPIEFEEGHIPGAINLPLLTDSERHEIGITYKNHGQAAAVELGHRLVSGEIQRARVAAWTEAVQKNSKTILYCFRGGLRSQITQTWLAEAGHELPIIEGGYKALRNFLISAIDRKSSELQFEVVSGPTGSGKTDYIKASGRSFIDLEALAGHRGSAFGAMEKRQPNQADFENALAVELLKFSAETGVLLIEDESKQIGHRLIPAVLFNKMQSSPKITLDLPVEDRVENIFKDYILNSPLGLSRDTSQFSLFRNSVRAISRKLGGTRTQEILNDLDNAELDFKTTGGLKLNKIWIRKLLDWYYDPFYQFALERSRPKTL
jgi:tRNA 2-selenouridine synthase